MSSDEEDERDWSDWGDDVDEEATQSLFSDTVLTSAKHALEYDAREYGFDLRQFRAEVGRRSAGSTLAEWCPLAVTIAFALPFNCLCAESAL